MLFPPPSFLSVQVLGDASKLRAETGWKPKITFKDLVEDMMSSELKSLKESTST